MQKWAFMQGDTVALVTKSDSAPTFMGQVGIAIPNNVGPGWKLVNGQWEYGAEYLPLSLKDFWRRFLISEREALQNILATGTQTQKNKLNAFRDYLLQGGNVELNDDYVISSVTLMETAGIIGPGRAQEILTP